MSRFVIANCYGTDKRTEIAVFLFYCLFTLGKVILNGFLSVDTVIQTCGMLQGFKNAYICQVLFLELLGTPNSILENG